MTKLSLKVIQSSENSPQQQTFPLLQKGMEIMSPLMKTAQVFVAQSLIVLIDKRAYTKIWDHMNSDLQHEVGGVLIGNFCFDVGIGKLPFLFVHDIIPCNECKKNKFDIVFSASFFQRVEQELMSYREKKYIRLGTYHSHPNYSVFLSDTDINTILNIFNKPHHIAIVGDPVQRDIGCFIWYQGNPMRTDFFVIQKSLRNQGDHDES